MRPRPLPSAIFAFLVALMTLGVATAASADDSITASDDAYSTVHDVTLTKNANDGVLFNDTDTFGNPQVALDQDVAHGSLTLGTDGAVSYSPDAGYVGPDSFTYHLTDVDQNSDPVSSNVATVTISVTNADPSAGDDSYSMTQGQTLMEDANDGVLSNDSDADGDAITAQRLTDVSHGTLTFNSDGSFTYTPNAPFFGTDHFTYEADDAFGGTSDPAMVTITVNPPDNSPPTADDDSYSTSQGTELDVDAPGVLSNDTDPDGDTLSAAKVGPGPSHGTLTFNSDGSFTYTPNAPFQGTDHFTYQASDGHGGTSDPATVTITVNAASNSPPTATDDSYAVTQGQTLTKDAAHGVLANDTDPDGDVLTAAKVGNGPSHGTLSLNSDGSFTYTPNAQFQGTDHFTYQASDGHGGTSDPATVTITVNPPDNSPPTADDDSYSTGQGTEIDVNVANGVLANDTDPDGDTLSADPLTGVSHGTLDLHTDGSFTYTPGAGFFGKDHFTYQADDGQGGTSDPTTATITVHSDEAPSAADNHYTFMPLVQGPQLSVDAPGVLANDTDPDGDHLTAHTAAPPKEGTVALNADGSFDYVPDAGVCNATDRFTYRASDGILTSTPAKVTIKIQTPRDPTAMSFKVSNHSVRFGQFVNLRVHLGRFSPGAVVRFFSRRPGGTPKPIGAVEPDPKTHVAKLHVRPARNTLYSALSDDNCFVSVRSGSQKVAVAAVGGGHMIGLGPHGVPTYVAYVRPTQPDGTVTFVWQRKGKGRWVPYFHQVVNLNDRGHVALGLTSGVVRHVRYRVTLRWTGKGGNLPGHGRWTYFQVG